MFPELVLETHLGFNVYKSKIQCNDGFSPYCLGGVIPGSDETKIEEKEVNDTETSEQMFLNHANMLINQRNIKFNFNQEYFLDYENEILYDSDQDEFYMKNNASEINDNESKELSTGFEHKCNLCSCNKGIDCLQENIYKYEKQNITIPQSALCIDEGENNLPTQLPEIKDAFLAMRPQESNTTCGLLSNIKPTDQEKTLKDNFYTAFLNSEIQNFKCAKCTNCSTCKELLNSDSKSLVSQVENEIIKANVQIDPEHLRVVIRHPVPENYKELLGSNKIQVEKKLATLDQINIDQVKESMNKLVQRGYVVPYANMSKEEKAVIDKHALEYYIPTTIVFKGNSLSTPSRVCLDASAKTSTGFALNDILPKGTVSMKMGKMLHRWRLLPVGICGDISKFYNCFFLDPDQWHLQKLRWNFDLDPQGEFETLIVKSVIYGLKNSAYSCEVGLKKIAELYPQVMDIVNSARYVDDVGLSHENLETAEENIKETLTVFANFGVNFKGNAFAISGQQPPPELADDNGNISIGACTWNVLKDTFNIQVPLIYLGKKIRGNVKGLQIFKGENVGDLLDFFPVTFA